jgi:hypothetical protein
VCTMAFLLTRLYCHLQTCFRTDGLNFNLCPL